MRQGLTGILLTNLLLMSPVHTLAQQISPQSLSEGRELSTAAARSLEAGLEKRPDDIAARLRLIGYYAGRAERSRHILWLVARRPDHDLFSWPEMYASPAGAAPSNPDGFEQWKRAWLDQLSRSGEDGLILFNAACSLGIVSDRAEYEEMTRKGRNLAPRAEEWSKALGAMYATVVVRGTLNPSGPESDLAKQSESILAASDDVPLLRTAAATVQSQATLAGLTRHATILRVQRQITSGVGRNTVVGGVPGGVPGGVIGGIIGGVPSAAPPPPPPPPKREEKSTAPPQRIRVGSNVQSARLKRQPKPVYPPLARQARIQGVVRFNAVIGKDGSVQNLQLLSGHALLVQAAQDAVKQWLYEPTLINGNPVEVITQIDVNFTLSQGGNQLPLLPCTQILRSPETSEKPVTVTFRNDRESEIKLYWVGPNDRMRLQQAIATGQSNVQSFEGHVWMVADATGACLAYIQIGDRDAVAVIGK